MRRTLPNLLGNQLVWLCAVAGAGRGWQWPALLAATLYVGSQLATAAQPRAELGVLLLALACAWLVDGTAAASGVLRYAAAPWGWAPPPWILALWAAFAMTLNVSMAFLQRHWLLAAGVGLLAPLAYLSAARGFGAVQFQPPAWQGLLLLGTGWAIALPLLSHAARRARASAPQPPAQQVQP
ncbi:DUF2878 domain-containing protein [Stenotrophomonas sp. 24(2023)]|uniref:DUF2878 domain-containing protein n=1 Tax=Stenotrophomonas sp. 24(2023) TaxID=3068324 RepID=UPI0027E12BE2|nr:DUF2878 domain-containing protein [Stenotrophomonas sp. 24(2023)]WMJ69315.1 DUF2878 domain-containing protein [Stenotrophomonas sp. 24(2023)]